MSRESAVKSFPALTVPPSLRTHGRNGNASRLRVGPLRPRRSPKGDSAKGGNKSGKATAPSGHCPDVPSTSKAESPGRSRLAALESGFSSFWAEMASMFPSLQGRLTASHPPGPKADESRHCDGGARGGEIFPEVPLASQQPCRGLLGPEALPLVGGAPGCDSSDPSHVMEPRGPANHTATAMDPVHGLQSGFGQTDFTLTTQRGAVLRSGYGSEGTGEVSMGMGSTAFTGHQSQPGDAARQPFPVIDSALSGVSAPSGVSALPGVSALSGVSALPGASASRGSRPLGPPGPVNLLGYRTWGYPCRTPGAFHFRVSLSCPGPSLLSRESGHPRDSPAPLWGPASPDGSAV